MKVQQVKRLALVTVVASFLGVSLTGCGGGGKDDPTSVALRPPKVQVQGTQETGEEPQNNSQNTGGGTTPSPGSGPGKLTGQVVVDAADAGSIPAPELVMFAVGKAPVDTGFCASQMPIFDESLLINPMNRGVQNVFIYLEEMPDGGKKQIASQSLWPTAGEGGLVLDQQNCTYKPHAMITIAGEEFTANSQDSVVHSYRGTPIKNRDFNLTIPSNGSLKVKPYTRPEKYPVAISCATHSWMSGYQLPLDHPYAAVTNADGKFEISDLPSGVHKFIIWHENKGVIAEREINVAPGDGNEETITFRLNQLKK